jgi:uncharacterized tellurite resistance protein B-like protein
MNSSEHLRNLLVMALADGSLGEREVDFVTDRCAAMGLSEDELRDAVAFALDENAAIKMPTDPEQQESLLIDLLKMMAADGVLEESEKRLFALAAVKLDFDLQRMDSLLKKAAKK